MLWFLCLREKVYRYGKFDRKILRLITNGIYYSDFYEFLIMFQTRCKILLSNLSQESIYIHLKQKGSNRDYFSMIDVINPKKRKQEMSEVIYFKKSLINGFLISFDF